METKTEDSLQIIQSKENKRHEPWIVGGIAYILSSNKEWRDTYCQTMSI
jgi:hypothetical protein